MPDVIRQSEAIALIHDANPHVLDATDSSTEPTTIAEPQSMSFKAHHGFEASDTQNIGSRVLAHFTRFGYDPIDERPTEWVFQRGSKLASLWRFDTRTYSTTLTVREASQANGRAWIACDWEVSTILNITTAVDFAILKAEGEQLESALRKAA